MRVQDLFSLRGQVALVTGGGAGIGKAICLMFAEAGADVACTELQLEEAESVASECRKFGRQALALKLDVMNEPERCATVEQTVQQLGKLTILVNNSTAGDPIPFDKSIGDFERALHLYLPTMFRMSQLCASHMKAAEGGVIINISSIAGQDKASRMWRYVTVFVGHLTRNMAFDLGPDKIRVNAIAPGAIRTAALATVLTPDVEAAMLKHTPLGRLGEGSDIAAAAVFLASPASAWISGQILTVSGGVMQELIETM